MKKNLFIIAEIAQAHDGSLGLLHSYIDALAETGVDAVKFQTHIAAAEFHFHMLTKHDLIIGSEWNLQLNNGVVSSNIVRIEA